MRTRVRISLAVGVIVVAISAVVIPPWIARERAAVQRAKCTTLLRVIDGAKSQWALQMSKGPDTIPTWEDIAGYRGRGSGYDEWAYEEVYSHWPPHCPAGGTYTLGRVADLPKCSILGHDLAAFGMAVVDENEKPISGATIEMIGRRGQRFKTETDGDGRATDHLARHWDPNSWVTLKWPDDPVYAIISKEGYITTTNTIEMIWGTNNGTVCLRRD